MVEIDWALPPEQLRVVLESSPEVIGQLEDFASTAEGLASAAVPNSGDGDHIGDRFRTETQTGKLAFVAVAVEGKHNGDAPPSATYSDAWFLHAGTSDTAANPYLENAMSFLESIGAERQSSTGV